MHKSHLELRKQVNKLPSSKPTTEWFLVQLLCCFLRFCAQRAPEHLRRNVANIWPGQSVGSAYSKTHVCIFSSTIEPLSAGSWEGSALCWTLATSWGHFMLRRISAWQDE